jgi:nucleoside-diphosphate-sugar epimerase
MPDLPFSAATLDDFLAVPTDGVVETLRRNPADILVAGAGGKMGGTLCLMLAAAAQKAGGARRIMAVSRFSSAQSRELLESRGVETISCDLIDRAAVEALPDAPLVIFMAGQKFGTSDQPELTWAMNTVVPANIAERYRRSPIVAFSTGCVYSLVSVASGGSREDSPTAPPGEYAHSTLGREGVFRFYSKRHGTPVALVRLNYSVEPRYGVLVDIGQRILSGQPVDLGMGHVNLIWQRDACAHAIQCLDLAGSPAVPVNVTGPDILSVRTLAGELGRRLGRVPAFSGRETELAWLNDASWSHRQFGNPPTPLQDMLDWTAAWLQEGGRTLGKPTHFETSDGKF